MSINWTATKYRPDYDDAIEMAVRRFGVDDLRTPNAKPTPIAAFLATLYRVGGKRVVKDMRAKHFENLPPQGRWAVDEVRID